MRLLLPLCFLLLKVTVPTQKDKHLASCDSFMRAWESYHSSDYLIYAVNQEMWSDKIEHKGNLIWGTL